MRACVFMFQLDPQWMTRSHMLFWDGHAETNKKAWAIKQAVAKGQIHSNQRTTSGGKYRHVDSRCRRNYRLVIYRVMHFQTKASSTATTLHVKWKKNKNNTYYIVASLMGVLQHHFPPLTVSALLICSMNTRPWCAKPCHSFLQKLHAWHFSNSWNCDFSSGSRLNRKAGTLRPLNREMLKQYILERIKAASPEGSRSQSFGPGVLMHHPGDNRFAGGALSARPCCKVSFQILKGLPEHVQNC